MIKRLLLAAFLVLTGVGAVLAKQDLIQKDRGGAVWRDYRTKPFTDVPIGGAIFVGVSDISQAGTTFVVSPKSGFIRKIWMTTDSLSTMTTTIISFLTRNETLGNPASAGQSGVVYNPNVGAFKPISDGSSVQPAGSLAGGPSQIQIQTTNALRIATSVSFFGYISGNTNWITQGSVLAINSDGQGSNTVPAHFVILIE